MNAKKEAQKKPYVSKNYPSARYPEAADYIDSIGIDARNVLEEGITDVGYYDRSFAGGKRWRAWPTREDGLRVLDLMHVRGRP